MTVTQLLKNLDVPNKKVDVLLDTDAFNEVDDQFAIAYMLKSQDKLNIKGFVAAPFYNSKSNSPADGMEKSYQEIKKVLQLAKAEEYLSSTYRGSAGFLHDEKTPIDSLGVDYMVELSKKYTADAPLYIVAIGAITNVASALLKYPEMKDSCVIVWLGGNAQHLTKTNEFNMTHDIAAARVVMGSGVPFVQLPCGGVVDRFYITEPELRYWIGGKNELADYLIEKAIQEANVYAAGKPWSRVIWDVTAVAWLLNDGDRFMQSRLIPTPVPEYDDRYAYAPDGQLMRYVFAINRDALAKDLFDKLSND